PTPTVCHLFLLSPLSPDRVHNRLYSLSLHDALPILAKLKSILLMSTLGILLSGCSNLEVLNPKGPMAEDSHFLIIFSIIMMVFIDRKSTRLNSSHVSISDAVFCL